MTRKTFNKIYLCGGNYALLDKRSDCPNALHDWPLPNGYSEAVDVASARLLNGWRNQKCLDCGYYGWAPSSKRPESTNPIHVTRDQK